MQLAEYLAVRGRSITDVHYAARVSQTTLQAIVKGMLLTNLTVAARIVEACAGEVTLADIVKPEVLAGLERAQAASGGDGEAA